MPDKFEGATEVAPAHRRAAPLGRDNESTRVRTARLSARLYGAARAPLRVRMLAYLLRPLSPLGLVAIAAGAFAGLLHRGGDDAFRVALQDVGAYSKDQIFELARFVDQVNPDTLGQVASLIADSPTGIAAFSLSAALILVE